MAWVETKQGRRLAVGKIVCLARNYPDHAKEIGGGVPGEPIFFLKPATAIVHEGEAIRLPPQSDRVQGEAELAAVIGGRTRNVGRAQALDHVLGYAAFQDITARDLQAEARRTGQPWAMCKGFDTFAPISVLTPAAEVKDPQGLRITLKLNGETRQDGQTSEMVFPVADLIAYISSVMTLEEGDIIATGTPAGVPDLTPGDILETIVEGVGRMRNPVLGPLKG